MWETGFWFFIRVFTRHAGWPRIGSGARSRLPFALLTGAGVGWMLWETGFVRFTGYGDISLRGQGYGDTVLNCYSSGAIIGGAEPVFRVVFKGRSRGTQAASHKLGRAVALAVSFAHGRWRARGRGADRGGMAGADRVMRGGGSRQSNSRKLAMSAFPSSGRFIGCRNYSGFGHQQTFSDHIADPRRAQFNKSPLPRLGCL